LASSIRRIGEEWKPPRIEVEALVAADGPNPVTEIVRGVRVSRLGIRGTLFSQPLMRGLGTCLRTVQADVVHLHEPNPLALVQFLISGNPAPLVIHYHSDIVRQKKLRWLYKPWLTMGLARAQAIVVGSRELLDSSPVLARWKHKCIVIPFGIELEPYLAIERPASTTQSARPLILAVGRLAYYKGFHYLIEAMQQMPAARLAIVGEGPERRQLEARIGERGLSSRVELCGRLDDPALLEWYRRADIFCLPSCERSEAFGLVQLEAMGAGLPVVSTDLPTGMRAINRHEDTGLVVPPHDAGALATALARLSADPALRRRFGAAARTRAQRLFGRDLMGQRILELYSKLSHPEEVVSWST
jgi:glycosyltransferase involved in cell wall biosynthesis